ncbi:MAG TPA: TonB-dependent receptor, partial [Verrucomicrobiae bacterium]|nr:TonB-dependent receptor [Verrucomicrobiae bacterium]
DGLSSVKSSDTTTNSEAQAALKKLSLAELMNVEVTLVSKRPENMSQTASAIQVITSDDIHNSGALSLPEALRLAPNLEVAQVNSHDWAISARGFNTTLANKLLVMIDGRTVYTPLDAGVFWDVQNVQLEDIDRIEVISGPGGALWGANAVNGVINIVTKSARDTQGIYASAGGGSFDEDQVDFRYGTQVASNLFVRVYGEHFDRNSTDFPNGTDGTNDWNMNQGGFRADWYPSGQNTMTLEGNFYSGTEDTLGPGDTIVDGQNVLGRWTHDFQNESEFSAQAYFDRTWRDIPNSFAEDLKTFDIDLQYSFDWGNRQKIVVGGGYRLMDDDINNSPGLAFLPAHKDLNLGNIFAQDEIALIPDKLKLTIGTKLEHNDYSGFEVQPSIRLGWTITPDQFAWAAVSRAVRSPSRIDTEVRSPGPPAPTAISGNEDFDSEKMIAYELGYRIHPFKRVTFSVSSYYNSYSELRSLDQVSPGVFVLGNDFAGATWGFEGSGTVQLTDWWHMQASYNYMKKTLYATESDALPSVREGNDPNNWASLQSVMDLPAHFSLDVTGRYVDSLPSPNVPAYITCDVRIAWKYKEHLELSIIGQNLLDGEHAEFGALPTRQEVPRSIFGKVTIWF